MAPRTDASTTSTSAFSRPVFTATTSSSYGFVIGFQCTCNSDHTDDHGTAFDIAGRNQGDARSMKKAMRRGEKMAVTRRQAKIIGMASQRSNSLCHSVYR
jgi:hypothetical protein